MAFSSKRTQWQTSSRTSRRSSTASGRCFSMRTATRGARAPALSGRQREEVSARIKLVLEAGLQKVKALERAAEVKPVLPEPSNSGFFASFLPPSATHSSDARAHHQKVVAEHRNSVVWLLQKKLVNASDSFRKLQEQWLEIQTRRDDGYLNIPKSKVTPNISSSHAADASAPSILFSGLSGTVNRAANLATTMAHSQLKSIVNATASVSSAVSKSQDVKATQQSSDDAEGWDLEDDFDDLDIQPPLAKEVVDPTLGSGLRQRGNLQGKDVQASNSWVPHSDQNNEDKEAQEFFAGMSAEKKLLLERENEALLEQFESGLDQIRTATQTIQEISSLQSQMAHHLQVQEKTIDSLHEDAWQATEHIEAANTYLNNSKKLFSESRLWLFVFFLVASLALLFLDWYYS
ncbi:hypothetical protein BDR26DRAFT_327975 [Obelidium mucronatum]|nr:hypothetical protein BDR26DRAFT_327975 [Obelidium mucronatum]